MVRYESHHARYAARQSRNQRRWRIEDGWQISKHRGPAFAQSYGAAGEEESEEEKVRKLFWRKEIRLDQTESN
jgi:hypothetical protein